MTLVQEILLYICENRRKSKLHRFIDQTRRRIINTAIKNVDNYPNLCSYIVCNLMVLEELKNYQAVLYKNMWKARNDGK